VRDTREDTKQLPHRIYMRNQVGRKIHVFMVTQTFTYGNKT